VDSAVAAVVAASAMAVAADMWGAILLLVTVELVLVAQII
jgi:hypothetical protein